MRLAAGEGQSTGREDGHRGNDREGQPAPVRGSPARRVASDGTIISARPPPAIVAPPYAPRATGPPPPARTRSSPERKPAPEPIPTSRRPDERNGVDIRCQQHAVADDGRCDAPQAPRSGAAQVGDAPGGELGRELGHEQRGRQQADRGERHPVDVGEWVGDRTDVRRRSRSAGHRSRARRRSPAASAERSRCRPVATSAVGRAEARPG